MRVCSEIDGTIAQSRRGCNNSFQLIFCKLLELARGFDDYGRSILPEKVKASGGQNWRRQARTPEAFLPYDVAGFSIGAARHSVIRNPEDFITRNGRRGHDRYASQCFPNHVAFGYAAMLVRAQCPKLGFHAARSEINHFMGKNRAGANREPAAMIYSPEFISGERFVTHNPLGARNDDLHLLV